MEQWGQLPGNLTTGMPISCAQTLEYVFSWTQTSVLTHKIQGDPRAVQPHKAPAKLQPPYDSLGPPCGQPSASILFPCGLLVQGHPSSGNFPAHRLYSSSFLGTAYQDGTGKQYSKLSTGKL